MTSYASLRTWQVAHELAMAVMRATGTFPRHERFELTSQLRRAALSVPCNLVEGRARFGSREYLRFVRIATGSAAEVGYLLYVASELAYLDREEYRRLDALRQRTTIALVALARGLQKGEG